ncbi:hypothetical protein [Pedobacter sp. SL55]|uniref:hypothetical protein n=1 Tax=Pedobacter sp. SL55 TaxID=2995161 RepID=UPI00226F5CA6|nr:hypothetical protein [Pedobacter sp. SL55]WAC42558.1 hypothetical protein OVA16_09450 [Pedobacter sp. SL55]
MKNKLLKHILIRLSISAILLLLLHLAQVDYTINANLQAMGWNGNPTLFIGSIVLLIWVVYLIVEMVKLFSNRLKWLAISNIVLIILIFLGYGLINILIAVTRC